MKHVITYYVKNGRPTKEQDSIRIAIRTVRLRYGDTQAADFGPLALKAVRQSLIDSGNRRSYVNKQVSRIKSMFKWAASNELIPPSVLHGLQSVSGLRKDRCDAPGG